MTGFLGLSRDVKRRHDPDARLGSVHALSQAAIKLLTLVLCIPPYGGGTGLRSQQLLRLTDLVGDALPGFDLGPASVKLCVALVATRADSGRLAFELLRRFDAAWVAVLRGQNWDATLSMAAEADPIEPSVPVGRVSATDRARLLSLATRIRESMRVAVAPPPDLSKPHAAEADAIDLLDSDDDDPMTDAGVTQAGSVMGATQQSISRLFGQTLSLLEAR